MSEETYNVEAILAERYNRRQRRKEWKVKWEGWGMKDCTWEPIENLETNLVWLEWKATKRKESVSIKGSKRKRKEKTESRKKKKIVYDSDSDSDSDFNGDTFAEKRISIPCEKNGTSDKTKAPSRADVYGLHRWIWTFEFYPSFRKHGRYRFQRDQNRPRANERAPITSSGRDF